ncbi:MAG: hypothetical protein HN350_20410 [Phycisphaerales bacterium]|jgi:hypothetical protein|nr:hypothetical protein [Phycisphaerales bacterium]
MMRRISLGVVLFAVGTVCYGADPSPNIHNETIDQTAGRTGYTAEEIAKFFPPIEKWSLDTKLARSFASERFKTPPKPGVHPRIYFGPDEIPSIRKRFQDTHVGKLQYQAIRGRLLQVSPRKADWESVPYKPKPADIERYRKNGYGIQPRMGYRGPWVGGWINELATGKVPSDMEKVWDEKPSSTGRHYLMHLLPYEAFRCLIDDDAAGGKRIAGALTTLAGRFAKDMDKWTATDDWQHIYQLLSSQSLGLTYDWAHKWMTDEQRKIVRNCIAGILKNKTYISLDHVPAFPANTSNWDVIHANMLPMALSIEGEEGSDPDTYKRMVQGLKKWVYVASGPQGAPFEGLNKSFYGARWYGALAMRGEPVIGTVHSKNHARKFLLHTMLPWGGEHMFETCAAPLAKDIRHFKYAHPSDPVIDLLYGATVRDRFKEGAVGTWPNCRTTYPPPWNLYIADDPIGAKDGKYDYDKAFDHVMSGLKDNEPLGYYSDYRGLLTARSGWDRNAAFLYFEPRNVPGGHTRASRNEFVFAALGRLWAHRTEEVEDTSEFHSVVLIDGKGQGKSGGRCPAGRTVALDNNPTATFAAADAALAYSHLMVSGDKIKKGAKPVPVTPNYSRLNKSPLPWMDKPWSFLPNWRTGCKPGEKLDPMGHGYWIDYNLVQYAYRTCGLVRGDKPYAIIVDDIRKDDEDHEYTWLMQIPGDLTIASNTIRKIAGASVVDVILGDKTDRRLLVRVFAGGEGGVKLDPVTREFRNRKYAYHRLVMKQDSKIGHFKVMLHAFRKGEELPGTTLGDNGAKVTVKFGKKTDTLRFDTNKDGRTRVTIDRGGKKICEVK